MNYSGLLFDLDGTLLDTNELIIQTFQHTFLTHYNRLITPEEVYPYFGKPLRAAMENLGPGREDELISTYREFNLSHHDQLTKVFEGVANTLSELDNQGLQMAIVTSKTKKTAIRGLRLFHLDKYFPVVIGCQECEFHKPHPEPVVKALVGLGLSAETCLMVGDSPFDLQSAREAGVKTAAVKWTKVAWESIQIEKPDYILHSFADLLAICNQ